MKVLFVITTLVQVLVSCATNVPETEATETAEIAQQQQQVRGGGNRDLQQKTVLGIKLYTPEAAPGYSDVYTTTTAVTTSTTSTSLIVDSDQDLGYAFEYAPPTTVEAAVYSDRYSDGNTVRATPNALIVNTSSRQGPVNYIINNWFSPYIGPRTLDFVVGDSLEFRWDAATKGSQNVFIHPSGTCDDTDSIEVGRASPATYTFTAADLGSVAADVEIFFATEFGTECEGGQNVMVTLRAEPLPPGSTPRPTRSPIRSPTRPPTNPPTRSPTRSPERAPTTRPGFRYYGYYTSKGGKKGAKGKGTCNGKGGGSQTRRPTPSPTRSPAAPPTTRAPASPTPENPEKAAFIREFGQQQYDCTTCGTTSTDTTCPPSCRSLGPGNAFDTNKCLVGVKGTYDAKTPNVTPDANFPKVGPEPVRGKCCQQTGFLPTWTGNSCSCVGGTPCVQPCGQGGPCFATGDPPVGCAFKGSTPPDSQCNKQKLSVSNISRAGYYGGTRSEYYGCNYYGGKKGGYYTSKGGKKGSKGSKGKGKGGGARTRSPTQRPTPAPTTSLGPSSKLPAAVINTINQESPFLYLAYNPSDITSEGSLSYSTFCRPGKFLNVQFTNLTANGGNGEVFCINNTKNTSGTQLGYGNESPNFDTRFPTMKLNLNQTCDGDDDSGSTSGGKNYCGFRGKQSYFPLSQIVDTLTNDGNFDIDIENTASITTYCQVNEYTNVRAVNPSGTVLCVTGAAGGIVNLVTNNEADIVEVLVDGKKSDNCDVPVDGLFTKGSTIRNITDSYPCGFNGVANTIFPNF